MKCPSDQCQIGVGTRQVSEHFETADAQGSLGRCGQVLRSRTRRHDVLPACNRLRYGAHPLRAIHDREVVCCDARRFCTDGGRADGCRPARRRRRGGGTRRARRRGELRDPRAARLPGEGPRRCPTHPSTQIPPRASSSFTNTKTKKRASSHHSRARFLLRPSRGGWRDATPSSGTLRTVAPGSYSIRGRDDLNEPSGFNCRIQTADELWGSGRKSSVSYPFRGNRPCRTS